MAVFAFCIVRPTNRTIARTVGAGGGRFVGDRSPTGDLEDGDDSLVGDADFVDEGFDRSFAFAGAGSDGVGEVGPEPIKGAGCGWLGLPVEGVGEVVAAGLELCQFVPELLDAGSGGGVVHGLVLERRVVAIDLCLGGGDLGGNGIDLGVPVSVAVVELALSGGDGLGEDGLGVG